MDKFKTQNGIEGKSWNDINVDEMSAKIHKSLAVKEAIKITDIYYERWKHLTLDGCKLLSEDAWSSFSDMFDSLYIFLMESKVFRSWRKKAFVCPAVHTPLLSGFERKTQKCYVIKEIRKNPWGVWNEPRKDSRPYQCFWKHFSFETILSLATIADKKYWWLATEGVEIVAKFINATQREKRGKLLYSKNKSELRILRI